MVGKKIRAYREFRGLNQIQLAELSGINVGTIRKYELGLRNPKPEQLERIASALGLNVSIFLDFNIETVGDVLSLLFAIDDSVNLSLSETRNQKIILDFDNPMMQDFFKKWCQFKNVYVKEQAEILAIEDEYKRQAAEIKKDKSSPIVMIKATDDANYKNLIDALDEMQICNISKYAIVDLAEADEYLMKNLESAGDYSKKFDVDSKSTTH